MNILFVIHLYYPQHAAGGESYVRNMVRYLHSKGHLVRILLTEPYHYHITEMYEHEGVMVFPMMADDNVAQLFQTSDVVLTHLGPAPWCIHIARNLHRDTGGNPRKTVFISHNTHSYEVIRRYPETSVIYNSQAMAGILDYKSPSLVLHPMVDYRKWKPAKKPGTFITLINCNSNKGGQLLVELAKRMPDRQFLGVKGAYDTQIEPEHPLPNLQYLENGADMPQVYRDTRILLMPSRYESWGMCATEAMACGIPVIYNHTFGLGENVGDAGIGLADAMPGTVEVKGGEFQGIDAAANAGQYMMMINRLDDSKVYAKFRAAGLARAKELDPLIELEAMEKFITP